MAKEYVCCQICYDVLEKDDPHAADLWLDLCALRLSKGEIVRVRGQDFPELRQLEIKGYVCSTDQPEYVIIRIKGHMQADNGEDFFCIKGGNH